MELRVLRYFLGVAEAGGMTRAARRPSVTSSALPSMTRRARPMPLSPAARARFTPTSCCRRALLQTDARAFRSARRISQESEKRGYLQAPENGAGRYPRFLIYRVISRISHKRGTAAFSAAAPVIACTVNLSDYSQYRFCAISSSSMLSAVYHWHPVSTSETSCPRAAAARSSTVTSPMCTGA